MPTYEYKRADGTTFEVMQRITDDRLEVCPTTGQPVTRLVGGGTGLIFKGTGFYLTDYARKNTTASSSAPESKTVETKATSTSSKSESTAAESSKPESTVSKKND